MGHKEYLQNEYMKLEKERDLYVKLLKEANLQFVEKVNELSLLKRIGDIIRYTFDIESFCRKLTDIILEETNAENCSLLLKDQNSDSLILKVAKGIKDEETTFFESLKDSTLIFSVGKGIAGKVALEGKPILVDDVQNDERFDHSRKTHFPIGSLLCVPLVLQDQVLGVVNLSNSQPHAFSHSDLRSITIFSSFVTSILNNTISYIEIKKSEEKFRTVFEGAKDAMLIIDIESKKIIDCNEQTESWLGYTKEELLHLNQVFDIHPPDCIERAEEIFDKIVNLKGSKVNDVLFVRKGGSIVIGEIHGSIIGYHEGKVVQLTVRDITERKKLEEERIKSKERYHNLIEFANVGIIITEKGKITQVNRNAEEIYGYLRNELIGKSPSTLTLEKYRTQHREMLDELLRSGKAKKMYFEEEGVRKDGSRFPIEIAYSLSESGKDYCIIAIMRDITERKKIEEALKEKTQELMMTNKKLERAYRELKSTQEQLIQVEKLKALGEMAGGVAHDFNNVLATILGRIQLLSRSVSSLPTEEWGKPMLDLKHGLEVIEMATLDGAETVRRLQEFYRMRSDDKDFTQIDLNSVIDHALEYTKLRWKDEADSKGIKYYIQKEFSPIPCIEGCGAELREVMTNLINNALDAMPQGGKLRIKTFMEDNCIRVVVQDSGVGISKAIRKKIFDPFFTTKGVRSTGLGLSVSYGIINRHRGDIKVDSIKGQGTTFIITLPIIMKKIKEEKVKPVLEEQRKASILVIEDEQGVRELLKDILTESGHEVEVISNGYKGINIFKEKKFDLVFTDLGMPGMSGWEVSKEIKKIDNKTPVILITGWQIKLKKSEIEKRGVDLVVNKPFQVDQVLRLVQEGMVLRDRF